MIKYTVISKSCFTKMALSSKRIEKLSLSGDICMGSWSNTGILGFQLVVSGLDIYYYHGYTCMVSMGPETASVGSHQGWEPGFQIAQTPPPQELGRGRYHRGQKSWGGGLRGQAPASTQTHAILCWENR